MGDSEGGEDIGNQTQEEGTEPTVYSDTDDDLPDPVPTNERERGDTWRTALIKRCPVCHTLTNKWVISGYPSAGPRCPCPAERKLKHKKLEKLLDRRDDLRERAALYDSDEGATERTQKTLTGELQTINNQISQHRSWFNSRFDDVVGVDPDNREIVTAKIPTR